MWQGPPDNVGAVSFRTAHPGRFRSLPVWLTGPYSQDANAFATIVFMSPRRTPVSRRDRPAKAPLSRAGVVSVAMRIMRDEGLERVTMRRLAAELDTGPASLYVYVHNTAELHGALLDELLFTLELPVPGTPWREGVAELLSGYTRMLFRQPSLARSVLTLRPSGPNYL